MDEQQLQALYAEEEEPDYFAPSPLHQDRVYVIMWQSKRSGGTYTELRKSVQGRNRFLRALRYLGVNLNEILVFEQQKGWVPEKKADSKKGAKRKWTRRNNKEDETMRF